MTPMILSEPTWTASFPVPAHAAYAIADQLAERLDMSGCAITLRETDKIGAWRIDLHYEAEPDQEALRSIVAQAAGGAAARALKIEELAARDWVATSLAGLAPVQVGRVLVHGGHDRGSVRPNMIGVEIEAALAFGTGHHATTRGCLLALDLWRKVRHPRTRHGMRRRLRGLDVGTGTGVLAIAGARLLRSPFLATDIDAAAVRVAIANAQLNRAAPTVTFQRAAGCSAHRIWRDGAYDLTFANILLGPLLRMASPLARLVRQGGWLVLSGLLDHQANAALAAYRAQGLVLVQRIEIAEWTTLVVKRPALRKKTSSAREGGGPGR